MTMTTPELTVTEMVVPASLDAGDAADFHAVVALNNAVCLADCGLDDFARTPAELLPEWADRTDTVHRCFIAHAGDELLGAVTLRSSVAEPTSTEVDLMVLPQHWASGAGQILLDHAEEQVRASGRRVLQAWTLHPADPGESPLVPSTGWGRVSSSPHTELLTRNGFSLEQVERSSAFDLQADPEPVRRMLSQALAVAGPDYRLVEWTLPTPAELREGYGWALSRMSTDVPSGGLDVDEEIWDADRIARRDAMFSNSGQTVSVSAVEHLPTGALVAFNELVIGADLDGVTHQYATLVLREHRGHRLGAIVKCANILRWRGIAPRSPKITTFNAEENRPMLDINERMGFRPQAYSGAWQKRLQ